MKYFVIVREGGGGAVFCILIQLVHSFDAKNLEPSLLHKYGAGSSLQNRLEVQPGHQMQSADRPEHFVRVLGVWEPVRRQRLGHISCPAVLGGDRCQAALLCSSDLVLILDVCLC